MEKYYNVVKVCNNCGGKITLQSTPFFKWENVETFICESCAFVEKKSILEKLKAKVIERGHLTANLDWRKIEEDDDIFFLKYSFQGKKYLVTFEKQK